MPRFKNAGLLKAHLKDLNPSSEEGKLVHKTAVDAVYDLEDNGILYFIDDKHCGAKKRGTLI